MKKSDLRPNIDWTPYLDEKGKLKPGYELNPLGYPIRAKEFNDPVPMKSKVAFKRPLSAHERVLRAIRTHEKLRQMNAQPGDTDFDGPDLDKMTPHQLMEDPISGKEMTAGEYHMLTVERAQASKDVKAYKERQAKRKADEAALLAANALKRAKKKASDSNLSEAEESEDADNAED